ncbi:cytochrome P450 315a1, mitochondrial [Fopius arisanus]|uniref:Cytochrome P450 315a1, mitochondrial n=1 Tax=Fopius arisanus TaxID=64838 RepID=A0A9R1TDW9_9HYME|nr:PREDICTED: cytochrome P450 315a1, mitochondrial [Fopius arisanus]
MLNLVHKCLFTRGKVRQVDFSSVRCGKFKFSNGGAFSKNSVDTGKSEIPSCRKLSFFENLKGLVCWDRAQRLHEFVDQQHRALGPIFRMHIGAVTALFINSPESYQRIFKLEGPTPQNFVPEAWTLYNQMRQCPRGLLFMNGGEWLNNRRMLNKFFLKPYAAKEIIFTSCENEAVKLCNNWKLFADAGEIIPDLEKKLYLWSIEVMVSALVGKTWDLHREEFSSDLEILAENLHQVFVQSARLSFLPAKLIMRFQFPVWRKFVRVMDTSQNVAKGVVHKISKISDNGLFDLMRDSGIPDENLVAIIADLIIAAGDTTTYSTQWALYLLATHQDVQEKLFDISRSNSPQEIINNSYVKGILRESLRLYPTAPFLMRSLPEDSIIEGYKINKGELMIMSMYSSGRDNNNFPEASEFNPLRWTRDSRNKYEKVTNPLGTLPFAAGARSCVGKKVAETQIALTISKLVKTFRITCDNAEKVKMILHLISVPSEPLKLRLTTRSK